MSNGTVGFLILLVILVAVVIVLKVGGFRVVYPNARILRIFGRPVAVKNRPGYGWLPPIKFVADGVTLPGTWQKLDLPMEEVLSSDGVSVDLEVDVMWRIKRQAADDPRLETGVMSPRDAIRFQASWQSGQFEAAVGQIVRSTAESVIRRYRSTSLGQKRVWEELSRKIEEGLDKIGDEWGVDFKPNVAQLQAKAVVQATEAKVRAQIAKAERLAEAQGLQEAVEFLETQLGNSPHAKAVIGTFLTQQKLRSLPKGTTLVDVGENVLGALGGLVSERINEKRRR